MAKRAPCVDCGKETEPHTSHGQPFFTQWDTYIVRDAVWADAGMTGWDSGSLCTPCLTTRLGRPLTEADYLSWTVRASRQYLYVKFVDDYLDHPSVTSNPAEAAKLSASLGTRVFRVAWKDVPKRE